MLKRVGESRHPYRTLNCCLEPVSYAVVEEDGTSGLVIEVFYDLDKVGADVLLHGCPQSCMPNPVEGHLEVYEDMVEVLLVLEIFFSQRMTTPFFAQTERLQFNHKRKGSQLESRTSQPN